MEVIENFQKDLPLKARAAINLIEKLQKEMINESHQFHQSLILADGVGIGKQIASQKTAIPSLFEMDDKIIDFSDSFLKNLYDIHSHISHLMLTKMEKKSDFDQFEKYLMDIDSIIQHLINIHSDISLFQEKYKNSSQLSINQEFLITLLKGHKQYLKYEFHFIITNLDIIRRTYKRLVEL